MLHNNSLVYDDEKAPFGYNSYVDALRDRSPSYYRDIAVYRGGTPTEEQARSAYLSQYSDDTDTLRDNTDIPSDPIGPMPPEVQPSPSQNGMGDLLFGALISILVSKLLS